MALNFSQTQRISQKQLQKLGQMQIQALKYLSMNSMDLRKEIYNEVEKNPALEITDDSMEDWDYSDPKPSAELNEYTTVRTVSALGLEKANAFQDILENSPDNTETLSDHLKSQFDMLNIPENQKVLGEKLIYNLDKNGFHILAPVSFLNYETDTDEDLSACLNIIQKLDPCGCFCQNIEESLLVQAKNVKGASDTTLFILNGHLDFLDPPVNAKVLKKLKDFAKTESEKAFNNVDYSFIEEIDEEDIQDTISFIQSLNPHPAGEYSASENSFVIPDIRVTKIPRIKKELEFENDIVIGSDENSHSFVVHSEKGIIPEVTMSSEYIEMMNMKGISQEQKEGLEKSFQEAKSFIESLLYREDSVFNAALAIVHAQLEFFEYGPGHLNTLRQKDVAELLGVHETTVSRMANSKYLQCEWGLFPFKYFFVGGISQGTSSDFRNCTESEDAMTAVLQSEGGKNSSHEAASEISKDKIIFEIKQILDAQPPEAKKLSDQKLSDMLAERGIKVARRTIAKYRSQIGVKSSYDR